MLNISSSSVVEVYAFVGLDAVNTSVRGSALLEFVNDIFFLILTPVPAIFVVSRGARLRLEKVPSCDTRGVAPSGDMPNAEQSPCDTVDSAAARALRLSEPS